MPKPATKNLLFSLILVLFVALIFELGAFSLSVVTKDFYGQKRHVLSRLKDQEAEYAEFLAAHYDSVTGWRNRPSHSETKPNCVDQPIVEAHDELGARRGTDMPAPPDAVRIIAVGDSYTYGADVDHADAYPTRLAELTGLALANQGVPGYGPLQALLRYEQIAGAYPNADIVVLGIMHENINRLLNAYRSALYRSSFFGFKPYVEPTAGGPRIRSNPNGPAPRSFDDFQTLAETAFDTDYWHKAEARFPYTVSFIRNLSTNHIRKRKLDRLLSILGADEFSWEYGDEELTRPLAFVIGEFLSAAERHNMRPVVAFIPQSKHDRVATTPFIQRLKTEFGDRALFISVGSAEMDWANYRIDWRCHPTTEGFRGIATAIYAALLQRGWLPGRDAVAN